MVSVPPGGVDPAGNRIFDDAPHTQGEMSMRRFRLLGITAAALGILSFGGIPALAQGTPQGADNFYTGEAVSMQKVTFKNQYKMTVAGNLFLPKALDQNLKHPAVIVGHPMGAVKEQSANLYAAKMAEQGFVTLSLDLSFWGESEGEPRNAVSPDIYAEDFSAAVDFIGTRPFVDREQIGAIGICGSGSFVLSADNAHAVHPNFADKADPCNKVILGKGVVVKVNASQKYTTSGLTGAIFKEICRKNNVPVQVFANRADLPGGSTLGNLQSHTVPVPMVDIGLAQLAMHSAVETAAVADADAMVRAVAGFYRVHLRSLGDARYTLE